MSAERPRADIHRSRRRAMNRAAWGDPLSPHSDRAPVARVAWLPPRKTQTEFGLLSLERRLANRCRGLFATLALLGNNRRQFLTWCSTCSIPESRQAPHDSE